MGSHVPLRHHRAIASFDVDTQAMLSTIYLDFCATHPVKDMDAFREKVADELLRLAASGERDPKILRFQLEEALITDQDRQSRYG